MHKCLSLAVAALLSLALAPESRASIVEWAGTLETGLLNFGTLVTTGTGLATINGSGTTSLHHHHSLRSQPDLGKHHAPTHRPRQRHPCHTDR